MPTVMVVDDAPLTRATLKRLLLREGYDAVTAQDGTDALRQLEERRLPDATRRARGPEPCLVDREGEERATRGHELAGNAVSQRVAHLGLHHVGRVPGFAKAILLAVVARHERKNILAIPATRDDYVHRVGRTARNP